MIPKVFTPDSDPPEPPPEGEPMSGVIDPASGYWDCPYCGYPNHPDAKSCDNCCELAVLSKL